jgi:malonyl CoA-acyl carrier protein transacylase
LSHIVTFPCRHFSSSLTCDAHPPPQIFEARDAVAQATDQAKIREAVEKVKAARKLADRLRDDQEAGRGDVWWLQRDVDDLYEALRANPRCPRFTVAVFEGIPLDDAVIPALCDVRARSVAAARLVERAAKAAEREVQRVPERFRTVLFSSGFDIAAYAAGKAEPPRSAAFPAAFLQQYSLPLGCLVQLCNYAAYIERVARPVRIDAIIPHSGGQAAAIAVGSSPDEATFMCNAEAAFVQVFWITVCSFMHAIEEYGADTIKEAWSLSVGGLAIPVVQQLVDQTCHEVDPRMPISIGGVNTSQRAIVVGHPATLKLFRQKLPATVASEFLPISFPSHSEFYSRSAIQQMFEYAKDFPLDPSRISVHVGSCTDGSDIR